MTLLEKLRLDRNLSIVDLARMTGVPEHWIEQFEDGDTRRADPWALGKLAKALDVPERLASTLLENFGGEPPIPAWTTPAPEEQHDAREVQPGTGNVVRSKTRLTKTRPSFRNIVFAAAPNALLRFPAPVKKSDDDRVSFHDVFFGSPRRKPAAASRG